MQIDWFTVGAQVVNFLILVFLLKRFLYKPVIKAMERRELALAQSKQQAEDAATAVAEQASIYQQKLQEIEQQKQNLLLEARQDAELEKERILQQLRLEVAEMDKSWRAEIDSEKSTFLAGTRQTMGQEMIKLLRKVLSDLANADLQQQVVKHFLEKLKSLSDSEKQKIKAALADLGNSSLKLKSSFEIPPSQQQEIIDVIKQQVSTDIVLHAEIDPELICGLALQVPGGELEWNINSYILEIEDNFLKNLSAPATSR